MTQTLTSMAGEALTGSRLAGDIIDACLGIIFNVGVARVFRAVAQNALKTEAAAAKEAVKTSNWPPNNGFEGTPTETTLKPGTIIDRYGKPDGRFASPKSTPFEARSLPPEFVNRPLMTYEVIVSIEGVLEGRIAAWFGQKGGGIQYLLPQPIEVLEAARMLVKIHEIIP